MRKVLWTKKSRIQVAGAVFGAFTGMFLLLFAIQIYTDISATLKGQTDLVGGDFLVINKKVSILETAKLSKPSFSEKDIEEIRDQDFIESSGFFTPNLFEVFGSFQGGKREDTLFWTSMFFESLPDEFLDVSPDKWKWEPGDSMIPIIIPGDFVNLYNFALAPSQNLGLLSRKTLEMARFTLDINAGNRKKIRAYASIVGYSDRINSVLVPINFMEYANANWATKKAGQPLRMILKVKDITDERLSKFLADNKYETNQEKMRGSRLRFIMTIIVSIAAGIGILIVGLSLLIFVLSFRIMIARSASSIRLLLELGFRHTTIAKHYTKIFGLLFGAVLALTYAALFLSKFVMNNYFKENNLDVPGIISAWVILGGIVFAGIFFLVNVMDIRKEIRGIGK